MRAGRARRSPKRSPPTGVAVPLLMLGLPDQFVEHGDPQQLLADCGLDGAGIARAIRERLENAGRRPGKAA